MGGRRESSPAPRFCCSKVDAKKVILQGADSGSGAPLQSPLARPSFRELGTTVPELCLAPRDAGVNPEKPGAELRPSSVAPVEPGQPLLRGQDQAPGGLAVIVPVPWAGFGPGDVTERSVAGQGAEVLLQHLSEMMGMGSESWSKSVHGFLGCAAALRILFSLS